VAGYKTVTINLSGPTQDDVTFSIAATGGTVTGVTDYDFDDTTLVITAGTLSTTAQINISDDSVYEGDETLIYEVTGFSANATAGAQDSQTFTITENDAPPTVQFAAATTTAAENTATHNVAVTLAGNASAVAITVEYSDAGTGSATSATDYTAIAAPGTLTFAAGDTSENIAIAVLDDSGDPIYEGGETIDLVLANPTVATLGAQDTHEHTIAENEAKPSLNFSAATDTVFENVLNGTKAITVTASGKASADMTVDYAIAAAPGTATGGGVDYTLTAGTATITAGNTSTTFDIAITYDNDYEGDQTAIYEISNPSANAQLGATTSQTLTIVQPLLAAALNNTACIVLRDQTVKCWGGAFGATPLAIPGLTNVTSISGVSANAGPGGEDIKYTAVTSAGTVKYWAPSATPVIGDYGYANVKQFAPGDWDCGVNGDVSMALLTDGTVANANGVLTLVGGGALNDVKHISVFPSDAFNGATSRIVRSAGNVGVNDFYGGFYLTTEVFILAAQYSNVRKAIVGDFSNNYQCALRNNGTIRCGNNAALATTITTTAVDLTMNESDFCSSSFASSACSAQSDGTVQCWNGAYAAITPITGFGTSKIIGLSNGSNIGKFIGVSEDHKVFEWSRGGSVATEKTGF
jgi:Calx-beta domain